MSLLTIYITKSCNLDCSFCGNKLNMSSDSRMVKNLPEILEDYLINNPGKHKLFAISGGEPLIDLDKLSEILSILLSHSSESEIMINTNGTYLTSAIVDELNNHPKIKLIISIDGLTATPRGLFNLIEDKFKYGYETLMNINRVNRKEINFVVTRNMLDNFNLAFEILALVKLFDCKVNLAIDQTKEELNKFSIDDIYKFQKLVMRLESLEILGSHVFIKNMFEGDCNGKNILALNWDGTFYNECKHSGYACSYMRSNMKVGFYDLLHKICNASRFNFDRKINDKPEYSTDIGFIGKRYNLEPIRKHANFKYKNLNAIEIKQV